MYDRGAGGSEGSLACPFLALADDRDARLDVPDRRHRCYADLAPAPRAIAHQQAYCLTAAFTTCPTFQDWVRREGARVAGVGATAHAAGASAAEQDEIDGSVEVASSTDGGGLGAPSAERGGPSAPGLWDGAPAWAAPPPWASATDEGSGRTREPRRTSARREPDAGSAAERPVVADEAGWGVAALSGRPLGDVGAGTDAGPGTTRRPFEEPEQGDRGAPEVGPDSRGEPGGETAPRWRPEDVRAGGPVGGDAAAQGWRPGNRDEEEPTLPPAFLAARRDEEDRRSAADRLRPVAADRSRLVEPDRREAGARSPGGAGRDVYMDEGTTASRYEGGYPSRDLRPDGTPRPGRAPRASAAGARAIRPGSGATASPMDEGSSAERPAPAIGPMRIAATGRRPAAGTERVARVAPADLPGPDLEARGAPPWERVRRREAYPDLRVRVGMPRLPSLLIASIAVVVAAILLFMAPTLLPGLFGGQPAPSASPVASVVPSVSISPTSPPAPTPVVYTVASGDTLSGIAKKFGLTLDELLAANKQIKDPNKLAIGDQITIPPRGVVTPGAAGSSAAPAGSALP